MNRDAKFKFEDENPYNIERLNELRAMMNTIPNEIPLDSSGTTPLKDLVSLNDIVFK